MNLCRCANGHFYDKEKYQECPHCASSVGAQYEGLTSVFTPDTDLGATEPLNESGMPSNVGGAALDMTEPLSMPNNPAPAAGGFGPSGFGPGMQMVSNSDVTDIIQNAGTKKEPEVVADNDADDDDDHTVAFYDDLFDNPDKVEKAANNTPTPVVETPVAKKPVKKDNRASGQLCVGWVVAIGGKHVGQDFSLKVGKNFIGRGEDMDICLSEDKSVSRKKHAIVVYEPKQHLYLVQPGESSELCYLNNEVVLSPVKLQAYDMITVGDVNLLFMPLCGDKFNWVDTIKGAQK